MFFGENKKKIHGLNGGRLLFGENAALLKKSQKITMPLVFDDSQNAGGDKGAPPECAFVASSASYLGGSVLHGAVLVHRVGVVHHLACDFL